MMHKPTVPISLKGAKELSGAVGARPANANMNAQMAGARTNVAKIKWNISGLSLPKP